MKVWEINALGLGKECSDGKLRERQRDETPGGGRESGGGMRGRRVQV